MKDREVTYEEVGLPFENIDSDYRGGQNLYDAVDSTFEELPKYSTSDQENGLRVYRNSGRLSFLNPSRPYMEVDIEGSGEYIHLRVELNAPSDHSLDNLQDDLEEFEESLGEQSLEPDIHRERDLTRYSTYLPIFHFPSLFALAEHSQPDLLLRGINNIL